VLVPESTCHELMFRANVLAYASHAAYAPPQAAKEVQPAPRNMSISVTDPTCHESRFWLKTVASKNMYDMSLTDPTCHEFRGWLKPVA